MSASASTNTFNINVSDHEVRITFIDQRVAVLPSVPPNTVVADICAEVVMAVPLFRQLLDLGDRLLEDQAAKKEQGAVN